MGVSIHKTNKKIKLTYLLVIFIVSLFLSGCSPQNKPSEEIKNSQYGFLGSGTEADPYIIGSKDDFIHFRDLVNAGEAFNSVYFFQTIDIDLASVNNWVPIGKYDSQYYFSGYYNGGGHTISNLTCITESDNVGLFGMLDGEVRNLGIESGIIRGGCVGSIASHGSKNALILNCYNKAALHGLYRAGGIADHLQGQVLFCFNFGDVTCDSAGDAAGLISYNCDKLAYCFSTVSPITTSNFVGELTKSSTVSMLELDADFLQKRHQAMQSWDSLFMESDKTAQILLINGNIQMNEMEAISQEKQITELQIPVVLLTLLLVILASFDYFINAKTQKSFQKRGC